MVIRRVKTLEDPRPLEHVGGVQPLVYRPDSWRPRPDALVRDRSDTMVGVENLRRARQCIDLPAKIHYEHLAPPNASLLSFCKPTLEHKNLSPVLD